MEMIMKNVVPIIAVLLLTGCAVSSAIERAETSRSAFDGAVYSGQRGVINPDIAGVAKYRIFDQGSTGLIPVESVRRNALQRATSFCSENGKRIYLNEETTSTPPHILGNWPRTEIVFSCIDSSQAKK
jgi:uncharacterized lipoprotein